MTQAMLPQRDGRAEETDRRRWLALAVIVAAQFMVVLDVAIVNVALPSIKTDLDFSQESLQWVITAYCDLLRRRAAARRPARRPARTHGGCSWSGSLLFTVSSLLDGLAWSEGSLIVFRSLQGLGAALLSPAALSILTTTFREGRERNLALGDLGCRLGQRWRGRRAARRRADQRPELVVDLLHQRAGRHPRARGKPLAAPREPRRPRSIGTSTSPAPRRSPAG